MSRRVLSLATSTLRSLQTLGLRPAASAAAAVSVSTQHHVTPQHHLPNLLHRPLHTTHPAPQDINPSIAPQSDDLVREVVAGSEEVEVVFGGGTRAVLPHCWLRDNCQCPRCYDAKSFTRRLLLEDWSLDDRPSHLAVEAGGQTVAMEWSSGHQSRFDAQWLRQHSFLPDARDAKRTELALEKELWGKDDLKLQKIDFASVVSDDGALLEFLTTLERVGVVILSDCPRKPRACFDIVTRAGFIKQTHYGVHYPIRNKVSANSLAYTDSKLGMHNDLPYYDHVPGIIFLHCITQFEGEGGENDLTDGFHVAQYLRQHHPEEYRTLAHTPVYFWNKGSAQVADEPDEFYKLLNVPIFVENTVGQVVRVNNSQLRAPQLDLDPSRVRPWYAALKLYNQVVEQHAVRLKLNTGETMVMDNLRLLHGRTAYNGAVGERYMDQVYLDWDEALSRRRVLQEQLGRRR